ncbi:hypothetical protein JCM10296v2_003854 [Rhodotorula toruloides]
MDVWPRLTSECNGQVSAILCAFTFLLTVSLALYERTFPLCERVPTGRQAAIIAARRLAPGQAPTSFGRRWKEKRKYFVMSLMALPACFWNMDVSQLLQSGAVNAYTSNLADALSTTRNKSKAAAGYTSAIGQIIPIVLTPCLGMVFDRFGLRMHCVDSVVGADQARLGTAFGVYKSLNSCGSVIVTVAAGAIQDHAKPGRTEYNAVFAFLIAIKAFDILLGLSYNLFDKRYLNGVLKLNGKQLRRMEEERRLNVAQPFSTTAILATVDPDSSKERHHPNEPILDDEPEVLNDEASPLDRLAPNAEVRVNPLFYSTCMTTEMAPQGIPEEEEDEDMDPDESDHNGM